MQETIGPASGRLLHVVVGTGGDERRIACRHVAGRAPTVVWLGGYRSDMRGTKAERLDAFARATGQAYLRLDYSGHGESDGPFAAGTISRWREDAAAAIAAVAESGPLVLVGSSMGAWIGLLLTAKLSDRLRGMLLLAPAPDFTERLLLPALTPAQRRELAATGAIEQLSDYSAAPNVFTRALIEDGRRNLVMTGPIALDCRVHVIQGMADADVPYSHALDLVSLLPGSGVSLTLVPGGDHRLSREEDLRRMERSLRDLLEADGNA